MTVKKCKLVIANEVIARFEGLDPTTRRACNTELKYFIHSARHTPAFKLGRWDGCVSFFAINGNTYLNLIERVLPIIEKAGYEIELEDHREAHSFEFPWVDKDYITESCPNPVWPSTHPAAGEPIILRDYQVEVVRNFMENPQCIQEVATGAGKCLAANTLLNIKIDENSPFGQFIISKLQLEQVNDVTRDNPEI